jgi:hypothetical protein
LQETRRATRLSAETRFKTPRHYLAWGHSQSSNKSIGRAVTKTKGAKSSHIAASHAGRILSNEVVAEKFPELASFMIALRAGAVTWFENPRRWDQCHKLSTRTGTLFPRCASFSARTLA